MKALVVHHKHRRWINHCYCCRNIFSVDQSLNGFVKHSPSCCCCPKLQSSTRAGLMIWLFFPGRFFMWFPWVLSPDLITVHALCSIPRGSTAQAHSLSLAQSEVLIQHQRLLQNNEFLLTAKCHRALDVELIGKIKGRPRGETCDLFPKQQKALRWICQVYQTATAWEVSAGIVKSVRPHCSSKEIQYLIKAAEMRQSNKITYAELLYLLQNTVPENWSEWIILGSSWAFPAFHYT